MGKFWIDDNFIRFKAQNLSLKSIAVYTALSSYANGEGKTFVGHRRIASILGINKDSVTSAMKELEASDLVRRFKGINGQASETVIQTVRIDAVQPSEIVRHKEVFKEDIKGENFHRRIETLNRIRSSIFGIIPISSIVGINN